MTYIMCFRTSLRTTRRSACLLMASCARLKSQCQVHQPHCALPHRQVIQPFTFGVCFHYRSVWQSSYPQCCLSSALLDITPIANGSAANGHLVNKPILIPNGGPSTMVPCSPETPLANGVVNGHITPVQESPFIGYIIAMHRKMVSSSIWRSKQNIFNTCKDESL